MDIKLETKQFTEHWSGEVDYNEVFYRYNIDGNLVWFSQMQDSGNIYSISVKLGDDIDKYFKVWVRCDDDTIFYPDDIEIDIKHSCLKMEEVGRMVVNIHYIDKLCELIMLIFKKDEHYGLWCKHHKR